VASDAETQCADFSSRDLRMFREPVQTRAAIRIEMRNRGLRGVLLAAGASGVIEWGSPFPAVPRKGAAWSTNMERYRLQQLLDPVPSDLHADTNQEKRRRNVGLISEKRLRQQKRSSELLPKMEARSPGCGSGFSLVCCPVLTRS
jgi:hypothetical protein